MTDKEKKLKNVILLTFDDFSYEVFSENIELLPNLKELKNKCVSFENAFSVGASTTFSFPGIIGGVYPYHFGVGIDRHIKSIDEILRSYGYNTAIINESNAFLTPFFGYGKNVDWQNHFLNISHSKIDKRLEDTFMVAVKGGTKSINDNVLKRRDIFHRIYHTLDNDRIKKWGKYYVGVYKFLKLCLIDNADNFQERNKLYYEFRNEVSEFVTGRFERPQFLWVHTIVNHLPYLPLEDCSKFSETEINYLNYRGLAANLVNHRISKKLKVLYIESMKRTDELVGTVIEALEINDQIDNTILVITSDHGEEFLDDGYFGHHFESSSDRLLRVPLMFYSPSMLKPKSVSAPVSTIDIFPTILDLLDLKIPDSCRGVTLKELALNQSKESNEGQNLWQRPIYSESWATRGMLDRTPGHNSNEKVFTVRKGHHKLKMMGKKKNSDTLIEKYELENWVSNEKLDLQNNNQIFEELRHLLYTHIYEEGVFAKQVHAKAEKQRIKKRLNNSRKKIF